MALDNAEPFKGAGAIIRLATPAGVPAMRALIGRSARGLSGAHYRDDEIGRRSPMCSASTDR